MYALLLVDLYFFVSNFISKIDAVTGEKLPGAELILEKLNEDNMVSEVISRWTSSDKPQIIKEAEDGKYRLTEITAPDGYEVAESIAFVIEDGLVINGPIIMKDKRLDATPSDATPPDATPSDATPSDATPSDATPSEPDDSAPPDEPDKPRKPSTDGSGGRTGGDSSSGPGVKKEESATEFTATIQEQPLPLPLPKTGDMAAASLIAAASIFTMIFSFKSKWFDLFIRNH